MINPIQVVEFRWKKQEKKIYNEIFADIWSRLQMFQISFRW